CCCRSRCSAAGCSTSSTSSTSRSTSSTSSTGAPTLTPPITPPEKRPDRHYNFGRMNMWFAVSSLGLLAVTLWMAFADYAQPWKRIQSEFRSLERQKLEKDAEAEKQRLNQNDLAQLKQEIQQAQAELDRHRQDLDKLEGEVKDRKTQYNIADTAWKGA